MKTWTRATTEHARCGRCVKPIAKGAPMLVLTSNHGRSWKLLRCVGCAGEPVPDSVASAAPAAHAKDHA
jgi:hypothetical protein